MQVIIKLLTAIFNSPWTFPPQTPWSDRGQRVFLMQFLNLCRPDMEQTGDFWGKWTCSYFI